MAPSSIRCYVKKLIEAGWVDERNNPKMKWDHTKQYRVNLVKIQKDLNQVGLYLEGYKINIPYPTDDQNPSLETSKELDEETLPFDEGNFDEPPEQTERKNVTAVPCTEIIAYLNDRTSKQFKPSVKKTLELIKARWQENHRRKDFEKVIDTKTTQWLNDPNMNKLLRPETIIWTEV